MSYFTTYKTILGNVLLCGLLMLCLGWTLPIEAQNSAPNYTTITKADGLPEERVRGLTEDCDGFVWFASGSSVVRWDGQHFQRVWVKDKKGATYFSYLWVASWDSLHILVMSNFDFFLLNTKTLESWELLDKPVPAYKPIKNNHRLPHYSNGLLWLSNYTGVTLWDLNKHTKKKFPNPNYMSGGDRARAFEDFLSFPDGSALYESFMPLLGKKSKWYVIPPSHDTLQEVTLPLPFSRSLDNLFIKLNDTLSLTFGYNYNNGDKILERMGYWHLRTKQWQPLTLPKNTSLTGFWMNLIPYNDHVFLFGDDESDGTAFGFDTKNCTISTFHATYNYLSSASRGILKHSSGVFLQDAKGASIVKFNGQLGLFKFNDKADALLRPLSMDGLKSPTVSDFIRWKDKWVMSLYDRGFLQETKDKVYLDTFFTKTLSWSLLAYASDTILMNTPIGAYWFKPNEDKIVTRPMPATPTKPKVLDFVPVTDQLIDSKGLIWYGMGRGNGVAQFDWKTKTYKHYPFGRGKGFVQIRYSSASVEDKDGNIYMTGQTGGGLVRWLRAKDSFEIVEPMQGLMDDGYSYPSILNGGLGFGRDSTLYIGSEDIGLLRYNLQTHKFQSFRREQGLSSNFIKCICFDAEGCLWLATLEGLNRFDPKTGLFKQFFKEHGLPSNEIHTVKRWDTEGYVLFIGCKLGYRLIDIRDLKNINPATSLFLTRFNVNNKPMAASFDKTISLSYNENNLDIEWAVVNFVDGHLNRFSYRFLNGQDTAWQDLGHSNLAHLVGLGSGSYRIQLRVIINGGDTFLSPDLLLHISTPFWKSVWFFILLGAAAIGLVVLYYRQRIRHLKKETAMRKNISADLHDDIGATLSNVNILTTLVRQRLPNDVDVLPLLKRIEEEISSSSESLDDIIWSVNPQNDSMERVLSRMRQFANEVCEAKGIEGRLDFDKNLTSLSLPMEKRRDFYLIYKEAVNNLAKYAKCKTANISLTETEGKLVLVVQDDGVGFAPLSIKQGNGQKTMRQRADRLHADLLIESVLGEGTRIELMMPLM